MPARHNFIAARNQARRAKLLAGSSLVTKG